jgi:flagellar protein FlaG
MNGFFPIYSNNRFIVGGLRMNMNVNMSVGASGYSNQAEPSKDEPVLVQEPVKNIKELKQNELEGAKMSISEEQLLNSINRAIKAVEGTTTTLDFSIHEKTKHIMVRVMNKETGDLIREIPQEKTLDFIAKIWEMAGVLVDKKA